MMPFEPLHKNTRNMRRRKQSALMFLLYRYKCSNSIFLYPKFKGSRVFLRLNTQVCVWPSRKHRFTVGFSRKGQLKEKNAIWTFNYHKIRDVTVFIRDLRQAGI